MRNLTQRELNGIHEISKQKVKEGIVSLDIFKAFDCVERPTLKMIIEIFIYLI